MNKPKLGFVFDESTVEVSKGPISKPADSAIFSSESHHYNTRATAKLRKIHRINGDLHKSEKEINQI